jgi:2-dehydro-3-deoxyphosphooctonate aldolase (KDO 8-P synthase)
MKTFETKGIKFGQGQPLFLIAGPCVIENEKLVMDTAESLVKLTDRLGLPFIFKSSYDKANRSSSASFRGPGLKKGLDILEKVRDRFNIPVLSDVHSAEEARVAGDILDILQIPAFLCRQTDVLAAAARTQKVVNVKKGQFMAPWDMKNVVAKLELEGARKILLTERGATFGYNNLVSDMRSLVIMREFGYPVIFDATHSVQLPGGGGSSSGGQREFVAPLARAAVAAGCDGLFMEVHPSPDLALSDGPTMVPLDDLVSILEQVVRVSKCMEIGTSMGPEL